MGKFAARMTVAANFAFFDLLENMSFNVRENTIQYEKGQRG